MKKLLLFLAVTVALTACSHYKIVSSWAPAESQPRQYGKILVLALINEPDRTIREKMELMLVENLRALGYNAVCSCEAFGPKSFEHMKEEQALAKLADDSIDAVLTVVLLDKASELRYVPAKNYASPNSTYHTRFWRYYSTMYDRTFVPGFYTTDTHYFWETNLYWMNTGSQLQYSAQSQSTDMSSIDRFTKDYSRKIISNMLEKKVITKYQGEPKKLAF